MNLYDHIIKNVPEHKRLKFSRRILRKLLQIREKNLDILRYNCSLLSVFYLLLIFSALETVKQDLRDSPASMSIYPAVLILMTPFVFIFLLASAQKIKMFSMSRLSSKSLTIKSLRIEPLDSSRGCCGWKQNFASERNLFLP